MYYRGAAAAIVVYDITNKESYIGAKSWVKELQRRGDPNVVVRFQCGGQVSFGFRLSAPLFVSFVLCG